MTPSVSNAGMIEILIVAAGYLLGSLSAGMLVAHALGLGDPRDAGSGNPGATNVLRLGGKKAAILTLIGDGGKGLLAVWLAHWLGASALIMALTGLAAFLGHLYPIFHGFRGGKGVATGFGVLLAWSWPAGVAALLTWLFIALIGRRSSLAALTTALLAPLYLLLLSAPGEISLAMLFMAGLTLYRHEDNIRRLLAGTEPRIGQRRR